MLHDIERMAYENRLAAIHPAEKVALTIGLLVLTMVLPPVPWAFVTLLVAATVALVIARVPARLYLKIVAIPLLFTLVSAAGLLVRIEFEDSVRAAFHPSGLAQAADLLGRSLGAISSLALLMVTTPVGHLLTLVPTNGAWGAVRETILAMYRTLFLLLDSCAVMYRAQQARLGYATRQTALRSLANLIASLWVAVSARSHQLYLGLTARGFPERLHDISPFTPINWVRTGALLVGQGILLVLGLEWGR